MTLDPEVVVLGDINLDVVVAGTLPFAFADLVENGIIAWASIEEHPGGSGLNFAHLAVREGYRSALIGCVGNDAAGHVLRDWCQRSGIVTAVTVAPDFCTGKAVIARDSADVRLLINNEPNANRQLSASDVRGLHLLIERCRVLYVSGYCVKDPSVPRYRATIDAMQAATQAASGPKPAIVFDVVPHRLYDTYGLDDFLRLTAHVDVLLSEVATIRRFLGLGVRSEAIDEGVALATAQALSRLFPRFVLRFGPSGCDMEVLWDGPSGRRRVEATGHSQAIEKRALGDWLAIRALRDFFGILASPSWAVSDRPPTTT